MGRLGNQLFQIATSIALAERNNSKYIFPPWDSEKSFNLYDCFSRTIHAKKEYHEPHFHYANIPFEPSLNINGFFQSERYFDDQKDIILGLLTPKVSYSINWNTTSIHVRRGDYVNNGAYEQLGIDYYTRAMAVTKSKHYMIFSDDISWCKKRFVGSQFTFSEGKSPVTDLSLQSSCEHNIIANSSFSWWGAYLNKNPGKIIVAPNKWFGTTLVNTHNTKDLVPSSWIKI